MGTMILIGNPGNKRTEGLQRARLSLGLAPAEVLTYQELLTGERSLEAALSALGNCREQGDEPLLRLDAPGELFEVERALIALGAPDAAGRTTDDERLLPYAGRPDPQPMSARAAAALTEQEGRLYHPSQWFRGFGRLLGKLEREAKELWPLPNWLNAPADIAAMFDKRRTQALLHQAGVPVPALLLSSELLPDYEALRGAMKERRMFRVFVKLAAGSGASGVLAYQLNPATGAEEAVTTLGIERYAARPPLLYNAIKLRRYSDPAIVRLLVNWLLRHGAQVEQWVPKATVGERSFDIRQLVVAGEACHSVVRASRTPITNLHLRSERMSVEEAGLSSDTRHAVRSCAERALAVFPQSKVAGIDVLLSSGSLSPHIVDMNPFGDLLYRVAYKGDDTYTWEMRRIAAQAAASRL